MSSDRREKLSDYKRTKELAKSKDPAVRAALAKREDLAPELLYFLAEDSDAEVRRMVALNEAAPDLTHAILSRDDAEDVRAHLAAKIAKSYEKPETISNEKSRQISFDALSRLAGDQITTVRYAVADAIKDIPGAPSDIIIKIASDSEIQVSGPVLQYSQALTDEDLIRIISAPPAEGARNYISKRQGVGESVSDAIVATSDLSAITDLLCNKSAQIQESTLDGLVDQAEGIELWHAPLVSRHSLSKRACVRLAQFVAENLIDELQQRDDIDDAVMVDVRQAIQERLDGGKKAAKNDGDKSVTSQDFLALPSPTKLIQGLLDKDELDIPMIVNALDVGDYSFVLASLIVKSGIDEGVAKLIFKNKSAKGITALCQLSDVPVTMLIKTQQRMGKVPPKDVLKPKGQAYPMNEAEAEWQIEFHTKLANRSL